MPEFVASNDTSNQLKSEFLRNDQNQNQTDKPYFARVNTNRQSIIKNENGLWSNQCQTQQDFQNIYTITLINSQQPPGPLGIHVIPTFDTMSEKDMGLIIQRIEPGGRVHRDGRLQAGDRIVEINRKNLIGYDFLKCQEILRDAITQANQIQNGILEFKIVRDNYLDQDQVSNEIEEVQEPESTETHNFKPTSQNFGVLNTKKIGTKIVILLIKGTDGLGFKLSARDNCTHGEFSPIYIKNILPIGAAVIDGRLQRGDRLLEVNKIDMTQKTLHEAVNILRNINLGETVEIVVSRQVLEDSEPEIVPHKISNEPIEDKRDEPKIIENPKRQKFHFEIPLGEFGSAGLGVSVKGKTKRLEESENLVDLGIYVKSIINGGAAWRDGRLKQNDQIININGYSLLSKSNDEAMSILKEAMHVESNPGFIELTVSRKIKNDTKVLKREESLSPVKQGLKSTQHCNRKSDEYGDTEQFSKFNRDAPSRRSVSEKRAKIGVGPGNYATFGRQRNQSLNDQNLDRSSQIQSVVSSNYASQTLGRNSKINNSSNLNKNETLPQNSKSMSMESIPVGQSLLKKNENITAQNKFGTVSGIRAESILKQLNNNREILDDSEQDISLLNRLNPKNRSFLTAVNKSIDKANEKIDEMEKSNSLKSNHSDKSNPQIKKPSELTSKHKSLIGKFQNLFKTSHLTKNKHIEKSDKSIQVQTSLKPISEAKTSNKKSITTENPKVKQANTVETLQPKSNDVLIENDTCYTQYIPVSNQTHSLPIQGYDFNLSQQFFARRESSLYQTIDHSLDQQQYLLEQQRIIREKQKKIIDQQHKYSFKETDRQSKLVNRNSSLYQTPFRSYTETDKIQFSAPFNASTQNNLVSDIIKESDYAHKYYSETASTTSSVISSTSSAYTSSSVSSEPLQQHNQPYFNQQIEFQNFSHITNITQV